MSTSFVTKRWLDATPWFTVFVVLLELWWPTVFHVTDPSLKENSAASQPVQQKGQTCASYCLIAWV